jgi:SpoVK/Ycf46/Vps4 family AAA+-type ATPase
MLASTDQWGWVQSGAKPSSAHKAWKNRLIEDSAVSGIWIANWIHAIDPALLRRFTLVLHVPNPPARQRVAILASYGRHYAEDSQLRSLIAGRDDISPADIERAHAAAQLAAGHSTSGAASQFLRALALRAPTDGEPISMTRSVIPQLPYRLGWLNTDPPMEDIVPMLAASGSARLCFWGPPGTGKTALAQQLADRLDRPLLAKKASDLISCWLGQTERNLAEAFAAARRSNALLLLDEADSFLRSREGATRSFEVTEVNQLLKELENFEGLVVLCTNHFESLDTAVLRRLDLKIQFSRLRAEAAREAFIEAALKLGCDEGDAGNVIRQRPLPGAQFALGDIAVAMRQARLRSKHPDARLLRDCLEAERRTRQAKEGRPIGFVSP